MEKPKIGFVGLGIMGAPMAKNIAKEGYRLTVFNRTRSRAESIASENIQVAQTPAEVAAQSEIIIVCVSDSPDVEEVILGEKGIIEGVQEGAVVIDMSTASPAMERRIDEELRKKSAELMDAPVSGGDVGAQNATLAIMAGGRKEAFERVRPVFEAMGKSITYCGKIGNGQTTKLCNQILVSLNLLGVSEAISLARKSGLDPRVMIEAVKGGAAGSWQLSNLGPKIVDQDFAPGFMIDLMQKDLRLVLEAGDRARTTLLGAALVHQLFNASQTAGEGSEGTQALSKVIEK